MKKVKGVKCKNVVTGKIVIAYHIEKCGAAHNKNNTLCICCVGIDLLPIKK